MADSLTVCAVLVFIAAVGGAGILNAKGFYCRDPDTGKLYPINATWPSDSFCGSYTCRIRKRNLTDYEYLPFRQLNLTDGDVISKNEIESQINNPSDITNAESVLNEIKIELMAHNTDSNSKNIQNQDDAKSVALQKLKELQAMSEKGDRYLTNPEIKALTDLLYSVKKSDLEAILEIYNIARDIYKEVDKTADEHILEETIKEISQNSDEIRKGMGINNKKPTSYWYEPLTVSNSKVKESEDGMPVQPINKEKSNLYNEGSNTIQTQPLPYSNAFHKDFSKLPYYYPISNFQRISSYIHQPNSKPPYGIPAEVGKKPCNKKEHYSPWNNLLIKKPMEPPMKRTNAQEPIFLPFPFAYVHHYNSSKPVNPNYSNENPWANVKFYSQAQKNIPSYVATYVAQIPNAVLINPNLNDEIQDIEQKPVKQEKLVNANDLSKNKPKKNLEWQTDDLPTSVLDEIKANMLSKSKLFPFPLRKKVKLERVGKVIKIEEHSRSKRETSDEKPTEVYEGYDVYLEKNTCQMENEPGFFRVGNLTEPFPACCPQRIGNR